MTRVQQAVPVLHVTDVARSMAWYLDILGFRADPFPDVPPYSFAVLRRDSAEVMLQRVSSPATPSAGGESLWNVYLRIDGGSLLEMAGDIRDRTLLLRGPERMFYGMVEFEIEDPDGYRLCLAEELPDDADVPDATEES